MSLPPLPQFYDHYEGEKLRYLVEVLDNSLSNLTLLDSLPNEIPFVYPQYNSSGSVGSTETTLYTQIVTPVTLYNPGWQIKVQAFGIFAGNTNTKELKLYLNNVVIYDSTALSVNGGTWSLDATIVVGSASSQQILVTTMSSNGSFPTTAIYSAGTVSIGQNNTIKLTGTGTANNDIIGQAMIVTMQPN